MQLIGFAYYFWIYLNNWIKEDLWQSCPGSDIQYQWTYGSYIQWQWTYGSYIQWQWDLRVIYICIQWQWDLRVICICTKAMGPSGHIQWKSRADTRLDLSQNNKLSREAYAYGSGIIYDIWCLFICADFEYL